MIMTTKKAKLPWSEEILIEVSDLKQQRTILFWLLFLVAGIGAMH